MSIHDGKPTNLDSGLRKHIGHFSPDAWHKPFRVISELQAAMAENLEKMIAPAEAKEDLRGQLNTLAGQLLTLQKVGLGVHEELVDISTGLTGFMGLCNRLDSDPICAAEIYGLLLPLARQLNELNNATDAAFFDAAFF